MNTPEGKIVFGEWLPDLPYLNNPGLTEAKNCIPVDTSYTEFLTLSTSDDALSARPQGAFVAIDTAGDPEIYAGTATALAEKVGGSWTDRTPASPYATAAASYWRFAQFDNLVIATNFDDLPQFRIIGSSDDFADLATTGTAPQARQAGVIGRFLMLGDTEDGTNGAVPYRVAWSGIDEPNKWETPGTAAARTVQSGEQFLSSAYGAVTAIANGQFWGLVFQQRAITRFTYIGGDVVFQIQEFERTRGCWAPQSMIQIGDLCFFLAIDGFYVTNGQTVTPIGNEKVDRWFLTAFDQGSRERMTVAFDYQTKCIYWSFPITSGAGEPTRILIYSVTRNRWAWAEEAVQLLLQSYTEGVTLEELDALYPGGLEDIPISFDSSIWSGGVPVVNAFSAHTLGAFAGLPNDARLETGETDQNPFGRVFIRGVRPLVTGDPSTISVSLSVREAQDNESRSFGASVTRTTRTGICDFRTQGRFVSARVDLAGGFTRALGIEIDAEQGDGI